MNGFSVATVSDYMEAADNRPTGFDYMRLILSVMVMVSHGASISWGEEHMASMWENPLSRALLTMILPMFFTLSGFLVAGSMQRSRTVLKFMGLRVIRIYPALAVDILFTALVIGPLVTNLPLGAYFSDPLFFSYLKNIVGHDMVLMLPGAFVNANSPYVNLQLWTIPFELACYVILGALMVFSLRGRYRIMLLLGTLAYLALTLFITGRNSGWEFADWNGAVAGRTLVVSFLLGVNLYLWRPQARSSRSWQRSRLASHAPLARSTGSSGYSRRRFSQSISGSQIPGGSVC
jgi:peptidoglycan/LPS O-acetylase OafA/YrhL